MAVVLGSLQCYYCTNASHSSDCVSTLKCQPGQRCNINVTRSASGEFRYNLGCKNVNECPSIVGQNQLCSSCCDHDLCNGDLCSVYQVDATWSIWSAWSSCSVTCGYGESVRHRQCTDNGACPGTNIDVRSCQAGQCNINALYNKWSDWSSWSSCSRSCGTGLRTRTRFCSGLNCRESSAETDFCYGQPCTTVTFSTSTQTVITDKVTSTEGPHIPSKTASTYFSTRHSSTNSTTEQTPMTTVSSPLFHTTATPPRKSTVSTASPTTKTTSQSQFRKCRDTLPALEHGYITNLADDMATIKCYRGYEFYNGRPSNNILCDEATQNWRKPYPVCRPKGTCSKDGDCNTGRCIQSTRTCLCRDGYFNTNCDTEVMIGVLVVRGPDWKWNDQDGHGLGNITQITGFTKNWVWVDWLTVDYENEYRVGAEGKYDLLPYKNTTDVHV